MIVSDLRFCLPSLTHGSTSARRVCALSFPACVRVWWGNLAVHQLARVRSTGSTVSISQDASLIMASIPSDIPLKRQMTVIILEISKSRDPLEAILKVDREQFLKEKEWMVQVCCSKWDDTAYCGGTSRSGRQQAWSRCVLPKRSSWSKTRIKSFGLEI